LNSQIQKLAKLLQRTKSCEIPSNKRDANADHVFIRVCAEFVDDAGIAFQSSSSNAKCRKVNMECSAHILVYERNN